MRQACNSYFLPGIIFSAFLGSLFPSPRLAIKVYFSLFFSPIFSSFYFCHGFIVTPGNLGMGTKFLPFQSLGGFVKTLPPGLSIFIGAKAVLVKRSPSPQFSRQVDGKRFFCLFPFAEDFFTAKVSGSIYWWSEMEKWSQIILAVSGGKQAVFATFFPLHFSTFDR